LIKSHLFSSEITLSPIQQKKIAEKIWRNECGGTKEGLTYWKEGEAWASLGIGHCIWYPESLKGPFEETFPSLIRFIVQKGGEVPSWLEKCPPCPWKTKEEFDKNKESTKMGELRSFLYETQELQMQFILQRMEQAVPLIVRTLSENEKERIESLLRRLLIDPRGVFALIDYVNCKGIGIKPSESYKGKGWGLLQVLERMSPDANDPVLDFVQAAKAVLTERVDHSPPERGEKRWLKGWCNRVDGYLESL